MESLTNYEKQQVKEIEKWKVQEPNVVVKGFGKLLSSLAKVAEVVIPTAAIEAALHGGNAVGKFLADEGDICRDGDVTSIEELRRKDLAISDNLADEVHNWAIGLAGGEGAAAGWAGLPGIAADIPALMILTMRTIHKIGLCYGYKAESEVEKQFALEILSTAGANSLKEKRAALLELAALKNILVKEAWKVIEKKAAERGVQQAILILIKQLCKQLGINLTKRKALQVIPGIGMFVAAAINANYIRDVGYAARRIYQERWLTENHKWDGGR